MGKMEQMHPRVILLQMFSLMRYLCRTYEDFDFAVQPIRPMRPENHFATLPRDFRVNENDGLRATSNDAAPFEDNSEMLKIIKETRKRNEQRREEEEKRHLARMRALTMNDEELIEAERVHMREKREMEEKQKEKDAQDDLERENRLKEMKEIQEQQRKEEERRKKDHEELKEKQALRWNTRENELKKIREETKKDQDEELKKLDAEKGTCLAQSKEESIRMKDDFDNRLRLENEQIEECYQEYCNRWRSQFGYMIVLMKRNEWNRKMENKWTMRLDGLRECFTPIRQSVNSLRMELGNSTRFDFSAIDRSKLEITVNILMKRLEVVMKVMENEVEHIERMTEEHPEAAFLEDIEESVREIREATLDMYTNLEKGEHKSLTDMKKWKQCEESFEDLEKKFDLIPTVSGLKEKYQKGF